MFENKEQKGKPVTQPVTILRTQELRPLPTKTKWQQKKASVKSCPRDLSPFRILLIFNPTGKLTNVFLGSQGIYILCNSGAGYMAKKSKK